MYRKLIALLGGMKRDEKGATAIEYGLIAALISVAIIAGASTLGGKLNNTFEHLSNCMDNTSATSSSCMTGTGATTP